MPQSQKYYWLKLKNDFFCPRAFQLPDLSVDILLILIGRASRITIDHFSPFPLSNQTVDFLYRISRWIFPAFQAQKAQNL